MDFSFFTTDNRSGHKTKETWFSKNYPKEYSDIINYSENKIPKDSTFKEKIWIYFHNLESRPKCCGCDNLVKFSGRFDKGGYLDFCSLDCANNNQDILNKRIKESNQKKWGVDYYSQHKDFIQKQKQTKKERYGDENFNNVQKMLSTKKEIYGSSKYNNIEKIKKTSILKYGVSNPSKSKLIKEKIKSTNIEKYGFKSPTESPTIKSKIQNKILHKIKNKFNENEFVNYDFNLSVYTLNCGICDNKYEISMPLYNERLRLGYSTCTICNPIGVNQTSKSELEIKSFISEIYNKEIKSNDRTLIKKELAIYLPNSNLAIAFNGLYWHSELFRDKKYHLNKTNKCQLKGVELIHVFEDEWLYTPQIVKSIIKNRLGLINKKIYARKCEIKEISNNDSKEFLNKNHIQGGECKNSVRVGLYYKDELVSLMTFSKGRIALGGKPDEWELVRFCNKIDLSVIGSASKLFNFFLKNYKPNRIISYSDIRLFNGDLYDKLGFKKIHESSPNYWYVLENKRYHRFRFRKDVLVKKGFDPNKTEKEIMYERGYNRIWDCGNIRWEYSLQ